MSLSEDSRQALARRLRALREEYWPGQGITQLQLAEAIGGKKPLSISLISSWESLAKPVVPPMSRLAAYASFFATQRSVVQEPFRVLPATQLDEDERTLREKLLRELTELRAAAIKEPIRATATVALAGTGLWHFPVTEIVTIVCAQLPADLLREGFSYSDPDSPDYVEMYKYADPDALMELFGHIRAVNPDLTVHVRTAEELTQDDYTTHLVLLGGVDWNDVTREMLDRVDWPVRQVVRQEESGEVGGFEVDGQPALLAPHIENGRLVEDVALFCRGINPFNAKRTVTICNGMYGRGTLAAVRALTDTRFRDRNEAYLNSRFVNVETFSILTRVSIMMGQALTPDWTSPEMRLHEWPENS